jgi:hypothetical protein
MRVSQEAGPIVSMPGSSSGVVVGSSQGSKNVNQEQLRQFWANKDEESPNELTTQFNDTVISNNT